MMHLLSRFVAPLFFIAPIQAAAANNNYFGIGIANEPVVFGSSTRETRLLPIVSYERDRFFVSTVNGLPELGVRTHSAPVRIGLQIAIEEGFDYEKAAEVPLATRGTRSDRASLGAQMVYSTNIFGRAPVRASLRSRSRLGDSSGALLDARISLGVWRDSRISAQTYAQVTWGDRRANARDFDSEAPGGLRDTRLGVNVVLSPDSRWQTIVGLEHRILANNVRSGMPEKAGTGLLIAVVRTF